MSVPMNDQPHRQLFHDVNNLLAVIYTQAAAARAEGTEEAAHRALELIEEAAQKTEEVVRRAREQAQQGG